MPPDQSSQGFLALKQAAMHNCRLLIVKKKGIVLKQVGGETYIFVFASELFVQLV